MNQTYDTRVVEPESNPRAPQTAIASTPALWTGRIVSALPALFCLMDGTMKLAKPSFVVAATVRLGYHENVIVGLGVVLTACTLLYIIPRTAVLGAILLTGYLGGAVASQVRADGGRFPVTFPIIVGILLWTGLVLRDPRVRALIPWRHRAA